jgi:hypothetical protein
MSDTPTTRTTSPRLPAELTDIIVDFLYDDDEGLANCSLVCKEWLPVARYHIVKEFRLYAWNVEAFVNLITHPSATIVPHVHDLVIDQGELGFQHIELFDGMFLRLPRFDFVRRLELRNICWWNYRVSSIDRLVSAFKSATDMTLDGIIFDNPTNIKSVVASFPSLKRLSVTHPAFRRHLSQLTTRLGVTDVLQHLRPPNIRDLDLSDVYHNHTYILDWFCSHGILVDSLSLELEMYSLPSLSRYLQVLGHSLLFLQMNVRFGLEGASHLYFLLIKRH